MQHSTAASRLPGVLLLVASAAANDTAAPFIDPDGYHAYIDAAEAELHSGRLH